MTPSEGIPIIPLPPMQLVPGGEAVPPGTGHDDEQPAAAPSVLGFADLVAALLAPPPSAVGAGLPGGSAPPAPEATEPEPAPPVLADGRAASPGDRAPLPLLVVPASLPGSPLAPKAPAPAVAPVVAPPADVPPAETPSGPAPRVRAQASGPLPVLPPSTHPGHPGQAALPVPVSHPATAPPSPGPKGAAPVDPAQLTSAPPGAPGTAEGAPTREPEPSVAAPPPEPVEALPQWPAPPAPPPHLPPPAPVGPAPAHPAVAAVERVLNWLDGVEHRPEPHRIEVEVPDAEGDVLVALALRDGRIEVSATRAEGSVPGWWLDQVSTALARRGFELYPGWAGGDDRGDPREGADRRQDGGSAQGRRNRRDHRHGLLL